jgi:hypothetical protein
MDLFSILFSLPLIGKKDRHAGGGSSMAENPFAGPARRIVQREISVNKIARRARRRKEKLQFFQFPRTGGATDPIGIGIAIRG